MTSPGVARPCARRRMTHYSHRGSLPTVAPETQRRIPRSQHLIVDGAVNLVAGLTAFAKRQMLEHKRPALLFVAFKTGLVRIFH